jgi:hypothetical protein
LHVLGLPPAFVLSQDQTLKLERFILDTNHSELTERHTRWRFRHRGGLLKKRTTPARVSATERPSPPKPSDVDLSPKTAFQQPARTPPPTFLFPLNTVKEQNRIRERQNPTGGPAACSGCPRKHGTDRLGRVPNEPDLGSPASVVNTGRISSVRSGSHPKASASKETAFNPDRGRAHQPGISIDAFGAVSRQRRRQRPSYRPIRFCVSTPPGILFSAGRSRDRRASVPPHCTAKQALPRPVPDAEWYCRPRAGAIETC